MKELTLGYLYTLLDDCIEKGLSPETPVFIGDDDGLNGIHTAFFAQVIRKDDKDDEDYFELISSGGMSNTEPKDINILIS